MNKNLHEIFVLNILKSRSLRTKTIMYPLTVLKFTIFSGKLRWIGTEKTVCYRLSMKVRLRLEYEGRFTCTTGPVWIQSDVLFNDGEVFDFLFIYNQFFVSLSKYYRSNEPKLEHCVSFLKRRICYTRFGFVLNNTRPPLTDITVCLTLRQVSGVWLNFLRILSGLIRTLPVVGAEYAGSRQWCAYFIKIIKMPAVIYQYYQNNKKKLLNLIHIFSRYKNKLTII